MGSMTLTESLAAGGPHHLLGRMVGSWAGTARTWFEPGKLADTSSVEGTIRPVLDGRFVVHEYRGSLGEHDMHGIALHGYDLGEGRWTTAWIDSCHNGTRIMLSQGADDLAADHPDVLGHYPDGQGGPDWGWRTELLLDSDDHLLVRHHNRTPAGEEALAVEFDYRRVRAGSPAAGA